jgi:hypothetical protein
MNMSREGQAMCFLGPIQFCRWQTTDHPNPDVNDDMEMFEMLGLTLKTIYKSFSAYYSWGCELSIYHTWENQNGQDQVTQLRKILKHQVKENNFIY